VVDDFRSFRELICSTLQQRTDFLIIGQASDGLDAVHKSEELKPDLVLLDIGLPTLNGMEAARRICRLVPDSKILFVSQESDADIVQEALSLGSGYIVKTHICEELLTAVESVLHGVQFVSSGLAAHLPLREGAKSNRRFNFEFDFENKIFQGKFHGPVTNESVKDYYRTAISLLAGSDFGGSITDLSDATSFDVTMDVIREMAALPHEDFVVLRPGIIVAPDRVSFRWARLFQVLARTTRPNLHVVRDRRQALDLLGVNAPRFQPIKETLLAI
jgi:DNA-binding NarL/FixJ family response regulator